MYNPVPLLPISYYEKLSLNKKQNVDDTKENKNQPVSIKNDYFCSFLSFKYHLAYSNSNKRPIVRKN